MDSGFSSGYPSLDRKAVNMIPSSSTEFPQQTTGYYPNCTPMNGQNMAMENVPPQQFQQPAAYQQHAGYPQYNGYVGYPAMKKEKSPGRRPNGGYMTPQQQIIQQQQQKIQYDQNMAMNGPADPFRNWNLGTNPFRNVQGAPSVHSLTSNMSGLSVLSRVTKYSNISIRTDIDDAHVQYRESVISMDPMLSPEMFTQNVERLAQANMLSVELARAVLYYLEKSQQCMYDMQKIFQHCAKLYEMTVATLHARQPELMRSPELVVTLFGIWYYLMKMPALKEITERYLRKFSGVIVKMLNENLGPQQRQNKYCLLIIVKILRQLFPADERKPVLRFLNRKFITTFGEECQKALIWTTIASNLLKYTNQPAAIEAIRLLFKTPPNLEKKTILMKEFVNRRGLHVLLECVRPGKYEATLYSACCLILDLVNDPAISKMFVQLGGVSAVGYHLEHESPPLVRKVARILRDTSGDEAMAQMERGQLENVVFKAVSNLLLPDKVCVEHVSGFLCNAARISWVKAYLWGRNAIRDLTRTLDMELNPQYPPKDVETDTIRVSTIDNLILATHTLMNKINRTNEAHCIIRPEDEAGFRKNVARCMFVDNEERYWNLIKELAKRCEMTTQGVEWRDEDIEIQRHIIMLQTHLLSYFPEYDVNFSRPLSPDGTTVIKIMIDVLQSTYAQYAKAEANKVDVPKKRERLARLQLLAERTILFFVQIIEVHQNLIPILDRHAVELKEVLNEANPAVPEKFLTPVLTHFQKLQDNDYEYIDFDNPSLL